MLSRRDIGYFIAELSRRRVFRVAVWYAVVGWATLEVATTVLPIMNIHNKESLVLWLVIIGAPITFALAWVFDLTPQGLQRTESLKPAISTKPIDERSVVVLPFKDLSSTIGYEYFSDGMTEDIIAAVSRLPDVKVISRTSAMQYRNTTKPLPEIAAELRVAHVLEGSVRRAGSRVRIVAQLIDAITDEHMWAETYDREVDDVFAIQTDVARRIAEALHAEIAPADDARLEQRPTTHIDAYDHYLRGRHLWNQRTEKSIREGIVNLQAAINIDPEFALALAALAESYVTLAMYGVAAPRDVMPLARDAAERALLIDPTLAEALTPLAAVRLHFDWDWEGAEADYRQAIDLNPRYPTAHQWYANLLVASGRFDEARAAFERARDLDPMSPAILTNLGIISHYSRDWAAAESELALVIERYPAFPLAHMFLGLTRTAAGRATKALRPLQDAVQLSGGTPETRAALACALAATGAHADARALLNGMDRDTYVSPVLIAYIHAALDEAVPALKQLERALDMRAVDLVWIGVRPAADPLRDTDHFRDITHTVLRSVHPLTSP